MNKTGKIATLCLLFTLLIGAFTVSAQNPYLPLWEHIPDGEPYVFEDPDRPGEYRVYIYGSHDSLKENYCGREQVVWSAPVDDLCNWRYDGIIFKSVHDRDGNLLNPSGEGDVLFAPDVTERIEDGRKVYYLYPNTQAWGRNSMMARSLRPDGPFEVFNWSKEDPKQTEGILGFDPAVFVDDDGRVYGYWGFDKSWAAELDPVTMATVKEGTEVVNLIPSRLEDEVYRFFEASSIRKIEDKYVFVYSRWTREGEFGLPGSNFTLAYAYGDNPLGPFTYGGTIIDGRARGTDEAGNVISTAYPSGNTHGSICEIDGRWWVFYHRQAGLSEYCRQAMVAPIEVKVEKGPGGKVFISEGEVTSEGFATEGLDPMMNTPAGIACHVTGPVQSYATYPNYHFSGSYFKATYLDTDSFSGPFNHKIPDSPVVNNTDGSVVGYKYFNFDKFRRCEDIVLEFSLVPGGSDGELVIMADSPYESRGGKVIGTLELNASMSQEMTELQADIDLAGMKPKGKHAVYFVFRSASEGKSLCDLYSFRFRSGK